MKSRKEIESKKKHKCRIKYRSVSFLFLSLLIYILLPLASAELLIAANAKFSISPKLKKITEGSLQFRNLLRNPDFSYVIDGKSKHLNPSKPPDEMRVFIIGESTASFIYPDKIDSFKSEKTLIDKAFQEKFPDKTIRIIQAGQGGSRSYMIRAMARKVLRYKPDIVLVLMGNNLISPDNDLWQINLYRYPPVFKSLAKISRVYSLLCNVVYKFRFGSGHNRTSLQFALSIFEDDYRAIGEMFLENNVKFIPFIMTANYAGIPPANYYRPVMKNLLPRLMIENGDYIDAIKYLEQSAGKSLSESSSEDLNSEQFYTLGEAYRSYGDFTEARKAYKKALSHDPSLSRVTPEINNIIRNIAREYNGYAFDLENYFESLVTDGLSDSRLFYSWCHWYRELNYPIFLEVLNSIENSAEVTFDSQSLKKPQLERYLSIRHLIDDYTTYAINNLHQSAAMFSVIYQQHPDAVKALLSSSEKNRLRIMYSRRNYNAGFDENWYKALAFAGEAARLCGDYHASSEFLNNSILESEDDDPYLPIIFSALLKANLRQKEEARLLLEEAVSRKEKPL